MFGNTLKFNQKLNAWQTSSAVTMEGMFDPAVFNQNINAWRTDSVTKMA